MIAITIRTADNGFIIGYDMDGTYEESVFQEHGTSDVQHVAEGLRFIENLIGPTTSRYSAERIYIDVRPGDKYEAGTQEESDSE